MPTAAAKSPKTKCSGSKGKHHCSSGHSSNTSTLKCLTLPQPISLPVPRSKSQRKRTSLSGVMALMSTAIPPPHLPSQMDISRKRPTQKTHVNSTPPSPLAPVGLMASAVQWDPTVRQLSSILPPSP